MMFLFLVVSGLLISCTGEAWPSFTRHVANSGERSPSQHVVRKRGSYFFVPGRGTSPVAPIATDTRPVSIKTLFSSGSCNLCEELVALIDKAQGKIRIAVYSFTDKKIAEALIRAYQRGCRIEMIVDATLLQQPYNKVSMLLREGIDVRVFVNRSGDKNRSPLMHHKFALFQSVGGERGLVWTGSFNFTVSAGYRNRENVIMTDDVSVMRSYEDEFEALYKQSEKIDGTLRRMLQGNDAVTV